MNRVLAIATLTTCGLTAVSSADLISTTWINGGDGLLTHDTSTGLYWLDWTQGLNLSRDAMDAELMNPASPFFGFRYATIVELNTLAANAGCPDIGGRTSANIPGVTSLLNLLGANNFYSFLGAGNSTAAHIDGPGTFGLFTIETFDNPVTAKAPGYGGANTSLAFGLGHVLVTTVPTPGAAAILGLGGLAALRRRR